MKFNIFSLFLIVLMVSGFSGAVAYSSDFAIVSPVVTGSSEIGFDSKLKSAGRLEDKYAAKDKGPANHRSFPFVWKNLPKGTKVLALILDDPDARPVMAAHHRKGESFVHWLAADIDPSIKELKDNVSSGKPVFIQGKNSGGTVGYIGPQPPADFPPDIARPIVHIYRLNVFALSSATGLKEGFTQDDLTAAIKGKTLAQASLFISYSN